MHGKVGAGGEKRGEARVSRDSTKGGGEENVDIPGERFVENQVTKTVASAFLQLVLRHYSTAAAAAAEPSSAPLSCSDSTLSSRGRQTAKGGRAHRSRHRVTPRERDGEPRRRRELDKPSSAWRREKRWRRATAPLVKSHDSTVESDEQVECGLGLWAALRHDGFWEVTEILKQGLICRPVSCGSRARLSCYTAALCLAPCRACSKTSWRASLRVSVSRN